MPDRARHRALTTIASIRTARLTAARVTLAEAHAKLAEADMAVGQAEEACGEADAYWLGLASAQRPDPMLMRMAGDRALQCDAARAIAKSRQGLAARRHDRDLVAYRSTDAHARHGKDLVSESAKALVRHRDERTIAANEDSALSRLIRPT